METIHDPRLTPHEIGICITSGIGLTITFIFWLVGAFSNERTMTLCAYSALLTLLITMILCAGIVLHHYFSVNDWDTWAVKEEQA